MKIIRFSAIALFISLTLMAEMLLFGRPQGDEFYPSEEAAERSALMWPRLLELRTDGALLEWPGEPAHALRVGERYRDYELVAIIPQPAPLAVLERNFSRWGILAYVGSKGPVTTIRKAVGKLDSLRTEKPFPPDYSEKILSAQEDIVAKEAAAEGGEPSYESLADLLPPLLTYSILGATTSRQKMIVWPDGKLGYGIVHRKWDAVAYDPIAHIENSAGSFSSTKQGLVGGYLPVIDYGFFDPATHSGWEEVAFGVGGEELETYVCLRSNEGKQTFWRLPDQQPLADGTEFYRALLGVQQEWEHFFTQGMRVNVPEDRVSDASKAAIVRALISQEGLHPKYGVGNYSAAKHDTFPPATIMLNWCLLDWGYTGEVKARLAYYLSDFVKPDGTFDYYGPAISEYGQMLALAARYVQVTNDISWLRDNLPALQRIAKSLESQVDAARKRSPPGSPDYGLLYGSAEADTREDTRFYFSGDVWCWRGLVEMGQVLSDVGQRNHDAALSQLGKNMREKADTFRGPVLAAMSRTLQKNATPPFLPPATAVDKPFARMTENELASYTNYRYWPEMLSASMLPPDLRDAIITYRTRRGGEVAGTTRLEDGLDDWPFAHYAWGLMEAGQIEHYLLGFYGHLAIHETPGTFTAYESVDIKGGNTRNYGSDYCVPAQVVEPQMLRWMLAWEPWDGQELWLARAVPKKWFETGFSAQRIPTRWGPVDFSVAPIAQGITAKVELASPHPELRVHLSVRSVKEGATPKLTVEGTKNWKWDSSEQAVELWGSWNRASVKVEY